MNQFVRKIEVVAWAVTFFAIIASIGIWLVFAKSLPPEVPLYYSLPWGEGQLVAPIWLFLLPGLGVIMGLTLGICVPKIIKDSTLAGMILLTGTIVQIVLILSLLRIVLLVS